MTISNRAKPSVHVSVTTVEDTKTVSKVYEERPDIRDEESVFEGRESLNIMVRVFIGDMTEMAADAIVCPTQTDLTLPPFGLAKTVLAKGGPVLQQSCTGIGNIDAGKATLTQGYDLQCKYVIHTAGPPPETLLSYDQRKYCLKDSYNSCLHIVQQHTDIRTVVFPCLGTGGANIQSADAFSIATTTIRQWLEIPENFQSVDAIILCMYNADQWNAYFQHLIAAFPYGKDKAGIDLESLPNVPLSVLKLPETSTSTNILCFLYRPESITMVTRHFQSLANTCKHALSTQNALVERYKTCAIIPIGHSCNMHLILYHSVETHTLELLVFCESNSSITAKAPLCKQVHRVIEDYLVANLENCTNFMTMVRCQYSAWGDTDGLWALKELQHSWNQLSCKHVTKQSTHSVESSELLQFWNHESIVSDCSQNSSHENKNKLSKTSREPDEGDWPSSTSLNPSDSSGTCKYLGKTDNREHSNHGVFDKLLTLFTTAKPTIKATENTSNVSTNGNTTNIQYQSFDDSLVGAEVGANHGKSNKQNDAHTSYEPFDDSLMNIRPGNTCMCQTDLASSQTAPKPSWKLESSSSDTDSQPNNAHMRKKTWRERKDKQNTRDESEIGAVGGNNPEHGEVSRRRKSSGGSSSSSNIGNGLCKCCKENQVQNFNTLNIVEGERCSSCCSEYHRERCRSFCSEYHRSVSQVTVQSDISDASSHSRNSRSSSESGSNKSSSSESGGRKSSSSESGGENVLSDKKIMKIAKHIGNKQFQLGIGLELSHSKVKAIQAEHQGDLQMQGYSILRAWRLQQGTNPNINILIDQMRECEIDVESIEF